MNRTIKFRGKDLNTGVVTWNPFATCFYIDTEGKTPNMNTTHTPLGEMWKSHRQELIIVGMLQTTPNC